MIVRFNSSDTVEFITRFNYKLTDTIRDVDVGKKCLPINLQDVFRKGYKILSNSADSSICNSLCIYYNNNNNIEDFNNNNNNNIYNYCNKLTMDDLKERAKGELVDIHYFPVKYKGSNLTTEESYEESYVRYNLKNALYVMVQMEQSLQWLIGYNRNIQFIIEKCDIELTLNTVANKLTDNEQIKSKIVEEMLEYYTNVMDVKYIASHYKDYMWNVDLFIGKERFFKDAIGYESYNRNEYIGVYLYGDSRFYKWSSITHKLDKSIHLFVAPEERMMLKRIQSSMKGKHNQFKNYLKQLLGKWFNIDEHWVNLRIMINRVDDSQLDSKITPNVCKIACEQYFNELGELCYNLTEVDTTQGNTQGCSVFDVQAPDTTNTINPISQHKDVSKEPVLAKLEELKDELKEELKEYVDKTQGCSVFDVQATNITNTITTISEPKDVSKDPVLAKLEKLKEYEEGSKEWWDALSK